jgi:hypothetical protein
MDETNEKKMFKTFIELNEINFGYNTYKSDWHNLFYGRYLLLEPCEIKLKKFFTFYCRGWQRLSCRNQSAH